VLKSVFELGFINVGVDLIFGLPPLRDSSISRGAWDTFHHIPLNTYPVYGLESSKKLANYKQNIKLDVRMYSYTIKYLLERGSTSKRYLIFV